MFMGIFGHGGGGGWIERVALKHIHSVQFSSVQLLSCVWLWPHEFQHARPPCPSSTPEFTQTHIHRVCDAIQLSHPLLFPSPNPCCSLPPIPPSIRVFSNESALHMRWPKYWSFSFSIIPSKEHPGLISFRMDWTGWISQESSPTPQFKSINSSALNFLHSPILTSMHDHWKDHSLD